MRYTVETRIERPVQVVFAFLSDLRHELIWNPGARRIEMIGDGPIHPGTRFRAKWRNAPSSVVTVVDYRPPERWATQSRSLGMGVNFVGRLCAENGGTQYSATVRVRATGLARLLVPFAVWVMRRQEARNLARIKAALENDPVAGLQVGSAPTEAVRGE